MKFTNLPETKNLTFTMLICGLLYPAALSFLDEKFSLGGRLTQTGAVAFLFIYPISLIGMVIWLLMFRKDGNRRPWALASMILGFMGIMSTAPQVIR
jgi:hypothetical protein